MANNQHSFREMKKQLDELGQSLSKVPMILQCNKQDVEDAVASERIGQLLGVPESETVSAVANTGPFRATRNPLYVATLAIPASLGLLANTAWVAVGSNAVLWLYLHFAVVPAEERFLKEQLGEPYEKYCATAKRWGWF